MHVFIWLVADDVIADVSPRRASVFQDHAPTAALQAA